MANSYHEEVKKQKTIKLREYQKNLPKFISEFFRGVDNTLSAGTKLVYAGDLCLFFDFLIKETFVFGDKKMHDLVVTDLELITPSDIEEFAEYLTYYVRNPDDDKTIREYQNKEQGKARKLSAVRSMFGYFYKKQRITKNPSHFVDLPKLHEKSIVKLDPHEVANLLDEVETGAHLSKHQQTHHNNTKVRDLAIITLLLGTGMRISECVGINTDDLDFDQNAVRVTRKGGDESILYYNDEVRESLDEYIKIRNELVPLEGHEAALFISQKKTRLTPRAVQYLVDKYSKMVIHLKHISPHKLRTTYGTQLYRESGDIYLVADALGHNDVNTTRKHYANMDEDKRRSAVKYINLRRD